MAMIDMKLDKKEAQEEYGSPIATDLPAYPYGLELCLNDESLEKLGLTQPPAVGTKVQITAMATVTGVRQYMTQEQKAEAGEPAETSDTSVDLQITALELGQAPSSSNASILYGNS